MTHVQYRATTSADEQELRRLLYCAISVAPGQPLPPRDIVNQPELARYVARWGASPSDRGVIASDAGLMASNAGVIGAVWLRQWAGPERGYGFVREDIPELSMAVVPGYRGRGIGTELLHRLLGEAAKHHPGVSLSVAPHNQARRLYERFGFAPVGAGGDSLTMLLEFRD